MEFLTINEFFKKTGGKSINEKVDAKRLDTMPQSQLLRWAGAGLQDGNEKDDVVKASMDTQPAVKLKPSQSEIFFGKALGMAILGTVYPNKFNTVGGYLGSLWSKENRILDGHHRWAATMLSNPKLNIGGYKVNMPIKDLIPVLRRVGELFGYYSTHKDDMKGTYRPGNAGGDTPGDINLYDAQESDLEAAIYNKKYMHPKFYNVEDGIKFVEMIGGMDVLKERFKMLQSMKPMAGAPPRVLMPVIRGENKINFPLQVTADGDVEIISQDEEVLVADLLNRGTLDIRKPYAK